jgi:dephospho-CoA kinase
LAVVRPKDERKGSGGGTSMGAAIGFAGAIASGKSTLITALSDAGQFRVASYGELIRSLAGDQGRSLGREDMQVLSERILAAVPQVDLARMVLDRSGWTGNGILLIDGIRHRAALYGLRQVLSPVPVVLVYVKTSAAVRRVRIMRRDRITQGDGEAHDAHPTELEAHAGLEKLADLVVSGLDLEVSTREVLELISAIAG